MSLHCRVEDQRVNTCPCPPAANDPHEEITRLVGHSSTAVTELVNRKQIRQVLQAVATVMDRIFDHGA